MILKNSTLHLMVDILTLDPEIVAHLETVLESGITVLGVLEVKAPMLEAVR